MLTAPSDFVPSETAVYLDGNGDGDVDPGEQLITEAGPLAFGETVQLVMSATLPSGLAGGEMAHVDLEARSPGDTSQVDRGNVVRVTARDEARVELTLESDVSSVMPGGLVTYTTRFANTGERTATDVMITDLVDTLGFIDGTEYLAGSAAATPAGLIEYLDGEMSAWIDVAPPQHRVKGARLRLDTLAPGEVGSFSLTVRVDDDHARADIVNTATAGFTGGDGLPYQLLSNEVTVLVGMISEVWMGPLGDPQAAPGSDDDRVMLSLGSTDSVIVFRHEVYNAGNFADTFSLALIDSTLFPSDWQVELLGPGDAVLPSLSAWTAELGPIEIGGSREVAVRISASPERLRSFTGRELVFDVEARSLVDDTAGDAVRNILVKADTHLLSVEQSIREPNAMIGDIVSFIVTVENMTEETMIDSIVLVERLPSGLKFSKGDEQPVIENNRLIFDLGSLPPRAKKDLVIRATVTAGQEKDELISIAYVYAVSQYGEQTQDGPAYASVRLYEGEFTRRGIVMGSVFVDRDGNGMRDRDEEGIRGAAVFYEKGTYAVTDSSGQYSIPGVEEGRHVFRVDPKSLPDSLSPGPAGHFGMGIAGQYLIDLAPSGNRRVDFPLQVTEVAVDGDAFAAIESDTAAVTRQGSAGSETAATSTTPESNGMNDDVVSGPAGPENQAGTSDTYDALNLPGTLFAAGSSVMEEIPLREVAALSLWVREHPGWKIEISGHSDSTPIRTADYPSNFELSLSRARSVYQLLRMNGIPEDVMDYTGYGARFPIAGNDTAEGRAKNRRVEIRALPPEGYAGADPDIPAVIAMPDTTAPKEFQLADDAGICAEIVKPAEGTIFTERDGIDIEVVAPLVSTVELYVNNIPVGREKIGQKQIDIGEGTLGFIFYGVKIAPGLNNILVVCRSHGEKNVCVRHIYLAGKPSSVVAEHRDVEVPADGRSKPGLVFLVSDEHGLPARDGLFLTVSGPGDLIDDLDANPQLSGVQVVTEDGRVSVDLPPSGYSRRERIAVTLEELTAESRLEYVSPMRDWFLFGFGEGDIGYSSLKGTGSTHRTYDRYPDGFYAEGKIAFYGQGEVSTGHLLTMAVDTRPIVEDKLLDRIEPEKYYPIYGDASELRFNTYSKYGTYAKLDNRSYSAMVGDYKTEFGTMEFTRYDRTFSGFRGEGHRGRFDVAGFMSYSDQITVRDELKANGTSGFYFLSHYPLLENSEKIRIEVRDRFRPEKIVRVDYYSINKDYDINYLDGSILFKEPILAFDENFNPRHIVVTYECRSADDNNIIAGIRSTVELADSLMMSVTGVIQDEGDHNYSLVGVDLAGHLWKDLFVESEYAHSEKFILGSGDAFRLKLMGRHDRMLRWSAYYRDIDEDFFNPSFSGGKTELGSRKIGGDLDWRIGRGWSLVSRGYGHRYAQRDERKGYVDVKGNYRSGALDGSFGIAHASFSDTRSGSASSGLLVAAGGYGSEDTKAELQLDKNVTGDEVPDYPDRIQAKLTQKIWKWLNGVLSYEYRSSSRSGSRHLTQLGIESRITENLSAYSRYRMEGAMSGERSQAMIGVKNRFRLSPGLTSTLSIEKLSTVSGTDLEDFTAFVTEWLFTPPGKDYKVKGGYEIRLDRERTKHLVGFAALKRLSETWAGLIKGDVWLSDEKQGMNQSKSSGRLGFSYRPAYGSLSVLSMIKGTYEKNSPAYPGGIDKALVVMTEANYHLSDRWELEGKVVGRWVENTFRQLTVSSSSYMYQTQLIRLFGRTWDVSVAGRVVQQIETGTLRYGGGIEVGRIIRENVWVGAGYDFGGHRDAGTEVNEFTQNGFHIGIKLKFDEKLLGYFNGSSGD
ncbi:MAG: OmpA family protein [Candidatus Krumholzibacteria bacterium]|nr:OmpA family protein [Candidatus Krumholzibacteria bacterium]